jgi:alkyl hydroperoxide reductase subunit AhpF
LELLDGFLDVTGFIKDEESMAQVEQYLLQEFSNSFTKVKSDIQNKMSANLLSNMNSFAKLAIKISLKQQPDDNEINQLQLNRERTEKMIRFTVIYLSKKGIVSQLKRWIKFWSSWNTSLINNIQSQN